MTGLEALNKIVNIFAEYCVKTQYQEMNATNMQTAVEYLARSEECRTIEKSLKALEIIKEKNVDVGELKYLISYDLEHALHLYNYSHIRELLTEEEYETIKEVLE